MNTIMQQKDPSLKQAVEAVLDGNITRSLEHLEPNLIESFNLGKDAANIWLEHDHPTLFHHPLSDRNASHVGKVG